MDERRDIDRRQGERRQGERRIGRPSKGEREMLKVRVNPELAAGVRDLAARTGCTIQDLIGQMLADRTGIPYEQQEALRLSA